MFLCSQIENCGLASISNRSELHCPDSKSEQWSPDLDGCKGLISNETLNAAEKVGFQIRPSRYFTIYAARAEESSSALLLSLSLPLRRRRSAFVALYGFVYGSVDKAVHTLAVGFCVGSEQMARSTSRARSRVIKFVKTLFRVLLFSNAVENVITQDCI